MNELVEKWKTLSEANVPWGAHLIDTGTFLKQYCALSGSLRPAFMSRSETEPPSYSTFDSVLVSKSQDATGQWTMTFELLMPEYIQEFSTLCGDMRHAVHISHSEKSAQAAQSDAYETWLDFYKRSRKFSMETARGLFGELTFIRETLSNKLSWDQIVDSWQGPMGGAHDFILPNFKGFEIKTVQPSSARVKISSENQLAFDGALTLVVYRLLAHTEITSGVTLYQLASACWDEMDSTQARNFKSKLKKIGFSEEDVLVREQLFQVEVPLLFDAQAQDFPKIVAAALNPAVGHVSYSLSIPHLEPYKLTELPL